MWIGDLGVDGDRYRYVGIQWGPCGWLGEVIWDALTGITLDEYCTATCTFELNNGKLVLLGNMTRGEELEQWHTDIQPYQQQI